MHLMATQWYCARILRLKLHVPVTLSQHPQQLMVRVEWK